MSTDASQMLARVNAAILREAGAATFAERKLAVEGRLDPAECLQRRIRFLERMRMANTVLMWLTILLPAVLTATSGRGAPLAAVTGLLAPLLFAIYNQFNLHRTLARLDALQLLQSVLHDESESISTPASTA